ncbi:sulfite exporter TauE/SafE family protein [Amphritea sp. 2_MG-2023]|uniref:sulfite exporter TauE/SafE family protein n=1 Tax=Amphritea TaxID=515417 RepID=UPI001C077567|nr:MULTISPECIES: sulfite exporter TauE/SafE family protein [Amphritea]MBU2964461.1 sulfite exporter TauE/SafE family protein [Amphritea atlantica]MDO6417789.1 sulfite exporter TauE/SafE family protein [Amphritea sp. 2_MG-2023]MDX2421245.1 sulfite exporter TauE/SafE family protein [Amphritea sp.]
MTEQVSALTALLLGLLGSAHCLGMCGGISSAVSMGIDRKNQRPILLLLGFNLGRIASYTVAGALLGSLGWLISSPTTAVLLRTFAGVILILMGLYVAQIWRGLAYIEKQGNHLWRHIQPLSRKLLPVSNPLQALALGALWGWLPCGLVYSTLIWSATASDWKVSALMMACFGLGTVPAMLATGLLANQVQALLKNRKAQTIAGLLIVLFGLYTIPWLGLGLPLY